MTDFRCSADRPDRKERGEQRCVTQCEWCAIMQTMLGTDWDEVVPHE